MQGYAAGLVLFGAGFLLCRNHRNKNTALGGSKSETGVSKEAVPSSTGGSANIQAEVRCTVYFSFACRFFGFGLVKESGSLTIDFCTFATYMTYSAAVLVCS